MSLDLHGRWALTRQLLDFVEFHVVLTRPRHPVSLLLVRVGEVLPLGKKQLEFLFLNIHFLPDFSIIDVTRSSVLGPLLNLGHPFIIFVLVFFDCWRLQLRVNLAIVHGLRVRWQVAWSRNLHGSNSSIFNEATILLLATLDHTVTIFLFLTDQTGLVVFAWIGHTSLFLSFKHCLTVSFTGHRSLIVFAISR